MSQNIVPRCDHCSIVQAVIYCKSDLAKLCLNCDVHVHSANPLSRRHTRSLICDKCCSQPGVIRCLDDKFSYCQRCHWHSSNCSVLGHKLQNLNSFTGCPSPAEYVKMWSSILEPPVPDLVNSLAGSLPLIPLIDPNNTMFEMTKIKELDGLMGSTYSMMPHNISYTETVSDQSSLFSMDSKGCPDLVLKLEEGGEDLCEGLNLDNAPLNFDVGDDIIGCSPQKHIESEYTETSPEQQDCTSYHQSGPLQMNINTGLPLPLPASPVLFGQIHPTMSLTISNITGHESSAAHHQDCGMSPGFIMSDSPWESNLEFGSPQARNKAKLRYKEKKLKRTFGKQIRYASRKARADTRKRVKGRFVKAGENYDYDPSSPTTNHS